METLNKPQKKGKLIKKSKREQTRNLSDPYSSGQSTRNQFAKTLRDGVRLAMDDKVLTNSYNDKESSSDDNAKFESCVISEADSNDRDEIQQRLKIVEMEQDTKIIKINRVSRHDLQSERDNFADFLFNRNMFNHQQALEQAKFKFKDEKLTFAPVIDQKSHSIALK